MLHLMLLPAAVSSLLGAGVLYLLPLAVGLLSTAVMSVLNGIGAVASLSPWPKRGVAMAVVLALMSAGAYGAGALGLPAVTPAVFIMASLMAFLMSQGVFHVAVEPTTAPAAPIAASPASAAIVASAEVK